MTKILSFVSISEIAGFRRKKWEKFPYFCHFFRVKNIILPNDGISLLKMIELCKNDGSKMTKIPLFGPKMTEFLKKICHF